jgi:hypothetical protein
MQHASKSLPNTEAPTKSPIAQKGRRVYLITSKDGGVLFDLDHDEFLRLDPVAAEMWTQISEGKVESAVAENIAQQCNVDPTRVGADLKKFLFAAAERGIVPGCVQWKHAQRSPQPTAQRHKSYPYYGYDPNQGRPKPSRFTVIRAFLALALLDLVLSMRSLNALCTIVSGWPVKQVNECDSVLIGRICIAVERACVWYPKKAVCLQRSAATVCLLKSHGIAAEMIVGARVMPMLSHAWVEVNGEVVNDHLKVTTVYQRVASF